MTRKKWTIAPLVPATAVRNISQVLLMSPPGANIHGAVLAWLIRSDDDTVLVDTGFRSTEKEDLTPEEATLVVNTHLHIGEVNYTSILSMGMRALKVFTPGAHLLSVPFDKCAVVLDSLKRMPITLTALGPGGDEFRVRLLTRLGLDPTH